MAPMTTLGRSLLAMLALLLLCALWQLAARQDPVPGVRELSAQMRDARRPDAQWEKLDRSRLASWRGPFELRFNIELGPDSPVEPLVLRLALRAASELYWDGQLLARNGRVGNSAALEQPGRIDLWAVLPPQRAGLHQLLVRASSQSAQPFASADAHWLLSTLPGHSAARFAPWLVAAAASGCLMLAWVYFMLVAWRSPQPMVRREQLLLLALGAVGLLLPLIEAWRPLLGYDYPWHLVRMRLLLALSWAAAWLLPLALAARWGWPVSGPRWIAAMGLSAAALVMIAGQIGYDAASFLTHLTALLVAMGLCLRARRHEPDMAWPLFSTMVVSAALALLWPGAFLDGLYVLSLALLMSLLLLGHAAGLLRLSEQAARSEASRLELQTRLLRSSMQPHWLMNTLTSLQELIETDPARASRMVDLMAEEFGELRRLGERPLIPLQQELSLCRAHLRILSLLRSHAVEMQVEGDVNGICLPPGLLHTVVENALTHGGRLDEQPAFLLQLERNNGGVELRLRSPRGPGRMAGHAATGSGRRFIEASLAAAFPGRWSFSDGPEGQSYWCSRWSLPCEPGVAGCAC